MANPPTNGWGASSTGSALATLRTIAAPITAGVSPSGGFAPSTLGLGLVVLILALAYWYRRVL